MYWKAIGTSVRAVYEHTYLFNRLWAHPVYPLGQTYGGAGPERDPLFRRFAKSYGGWRRAGGTGRRRAPAGWKALGAAIAGPVTGCRPDLPSRSLKRGSQGDLVVWAQEHLKARADSPGNRHLGEQTSAAVRAFQAAPACRSTARSAPRPGAAARFEPSACSGRAPEAKQRAAPGASRQSPRAARSRPRCRRRVRDPIGPAPLKIGAARRQKSRRCLRVKAGAR